MSYPAYLLPFSAIVANLTSGDIFDFYGRLNGLDFKETLAALAEEAGVRLESYRSDPARKEQRSQKRDMLKMHELAAAHFHSNLTAPDAEICRAYIAERGISPELVEKFALGWSMDASNQFYGYDSIEFENERVILDDGLQANCIVMLYPPTADFLV